MSSIFKNIMLNSAASIMCPSRWMRRFSLTWGPGPRSSSIPQSGRVKGKGGAVSAGRPPVLRGHYRSTVAQIVKSLGPKDNLSGLGRRGLIISNSRLASTDTICEASDGPRVLQFAFREESMQHILRQIRRSNVESSWTKIYIFCCTISLAESIWSTRTKHLKENND